MTIPPGPHLSDALVSSPILQGEDGLGAAAAGGGGFEFGVNPDDDPELALALRVSMEEQRARQQAESGGGQESGGAAVVTGGEDETSEEAMLQRALAMSMDTGEAGTGPAPAPARDLSTMTEEEQIAYAMQVSGHPSPPVIYENSLQMSMADAEKAEQTPDSMEVDEKDEDYSEVMNDPAFLQEVLQNLPGVDPQSEAVRKAVAEGAAKAEKEKKDEEKK